MELINDDRIKQFWFTSVPKPTELCQIIGYASISEVSKAPEKSEYLKILKCRQIIFMECRVIAAPSNMDECAVHIIMKKEFYHNGHILKLLEKLKLSIKYSDTVSASVYEACLRYTVIARVSPFWNQVGEYLIEGRDFLTNSGTMNAVKIEIVISEGEMYLLVWSFCVKLPAFHLEQLGVLDTIEFNGNEKSVDLPWGIHFAQVLPSLREVGIVRVSNNMSNHWLYNSYQHMRRHWKKMYGYRLPEDATNLLFCGVKFQSPESNDFTYPSVCLKPNGLLFFRNTEQKTILRSFLSVLKIKVPSICESQFGVEPMVGAAVPKLHFSNALLENPDVVPFDAEILSKDQKDVTPQPLELTQAVPEKAEVSETTSSGTVRSYPTPTPLYTLRESTLLNNQSIYMPVTLTSNSNFEGNMIQRSKLMPSFTQVNRAQQQRSTGMSYPTEYVDRPFQFGRYVPLVLPQASSTSGVSSVIVKLVPYGVPNQHFFREVPLSGMCSIPNDSSKQRKPRSRPKVQAGVDVEALTRCNDLARVNTATLINWLRQKNVRCSVKDRKADLVAKVRKYLKLDNE